MDLIVEACSKMLIMWTFRGKSPQDQDVATIAAEYPLCQILLNKLKWAGLNVIIPEECLIILAMCSDSPGTIQLIAHHLLQGIPNLEQGYEVTPLDFSRVFPSSFPIVQDPKWAKFWEDAWDNQKIPKDERKPLQSDNRCDTKEYWLELLKH